MTKKETTESVSEEMKELEEFTRIEAELLETVELLPDQNLLLPDPIIHLSSPCYYFLQANQ